MYDDYYAPPLRQNSFTHGLGGRSGVQDGQLMLSAAERSRAEAAYYDEEATKQEKRLREGERPDGIQVKNLRDLANQKASEAANGGRTESMLTRPESAADWSALNGVNGNGPAKYLPQWMQRHNTGETWGGFQAGGVGAGGMGNELGFVGGGDQGGGGGSAGGAAGGSLPSGIRESSYLTNNGQHELIGNLPGGQMQRFNEMPDGSIRSGGMVNGQYSAFSGDAYRDDKSASGSRFNQGLPMDAPPPYEVQQSRVPNVRDYGWDSTSGVEQDNWPTPWQMVRDYKHGKFENVTEDSYDPPPAPTDWTPGNKLRSSWTDLHTSQLEGDTKPVELTGFEPEYDTSWQTKLTIDEEERFRREQAADPGHFGNFDPDDPMSDYDMKGFKKRQWAGDSTAIQDAKTGHYPDTDKTPYHKTFSKESKYAPGGTLAGGEAPSWSREGSNNVLKSPDGQVVASEPVDELDTPESRDFAKKEGLYHPGAAVPPNQTGLRKSDSEESKFQYYDPKTKQYFGRRIGSGAEASTDPENSDTKLGPDKKKSALSKIGSRIKENLGNTETGRILQKVGGVLGRAASGVAEGMQGPPQLKDSQNAINVRTNVRGDGAMSREEAAAAGEITSPQEAEQLEQFKQRQILEQIQDLQSHALGNGNPQIAMDTQDHGPGRRNITTNTAFDRADFDDMKRNGDTMTLDDYEKIRRGEKTFKDFDHNKPTSQQKARRPMTHQDMVAMYLQHAMGGMA